MNYCIINSDNIIKNIIVCESDEVALKFNAFPSYKTAQIGDSYVTPTLESAPTYVGTGGEPKIILSYPKNATAFILSNNNHSCVCNQGNENVIFENKNISIEWYRDKIILDGENINTKDVKYFVFWLYK